MVVIMDPPAACVPYKDSSIELLYTAQQRGWSCYYVPIQAVYMQGGVVSAQMFPIEVVSLQEQPCCRLGEVVMRPLHTVDVVLMRQDPPFDIDYIFMTHLLSLAVQQGARVVNAPEALRDANEKLATVWFADFMPETMVSSDAGIHKAFIAEQGCVVLKPLDSMGGQSIFRVVAGDSNVSVMIDAVTHSGRRLAMAQTFIDAILSEGDKRILLIHGEPVPHVLLRRPAPDDFRGNLAQGAQPSIQSLTARDKDICAAVRDTLLEKGLLLVGLDVIGDYLTEVNVTSPTGLQEIHRMANYDVASMFLDGLSL